MRKIISLSIISTFLCSNVAFSTPETRSALRPPMQSNETMREFIKDQSGSPEGDIDKLFSTLPPFDMVYLNSLHKKFKTSGDQPLIIGTAETGGNFLPSALLDKTQRKGLLGAVEYADLTQDPANKEESRNVVLLCNPMDGGVGSSVARERYLAGIWQQIERTGKVRLGAKGTDLYFNVTLEGFDEQGAKVKTQQRISIIELKYLRARHTASNYGRVIIRELVNEESAPFVKDFLDITYVLDRIDARIPQDKKRTYRQIINQTPDLETEEDFIFQASLPTIDLETEELTTENMLPGGHGQLGTMALYDILTAELPEGKTLVRAIYNGDGPNNFPDAYIAGWMARNKIPIVMISTTKVELDKKGGQIGVEFLEGGKSRIQLLERAQAIANGQEEWFYRIGLPGNVGDEGTPGAQYFNTNTALINYSVLKPFLIKLRTIIRDEKFNEIITPDLIKNIKSKRGKQFVQLEGALGSALLNLNGFIQTTDNEKVKALLEEYGLTRILYIVNIDTEQRDNFFTPVKFSYDYWLYAYSDHFNVDPSVWQVENFKPGHVPGFESMDKYYEDVQNCIDALGNASTIGLDSLSIKGKVHLKDAILKGSVRIASLYPEMFDLNSEEAREKLGQTGQDRITLENIAIVINAIGEASYLSDYLKDAGVGSDLARETVEKVLIGEVSLASLLSRSPDFLYGEIVNGTIKPPSVGSVEPVADAYAAIQKGDYDKAYELLMEGLLGEDYVVNMETAIGVLNALMARYGLDRKKGKEIDGILQIVTRHQEATDQREMKDELAYFILADYIVLSHSDYLYSERIKEVIAGLRAGRVIFEYETNLHYEPDVRQTTKIDFRHNVALIDQKGTKVAGTDGVGYYFVEDVDESRLEDIPEAVLKLTSKKLGINVRPISENGKNGIIKHSIKGETSDLITLRPELWLLKLSKMTENDIEKCLWSLGKNIRSGKNLKKAVTKKLTKLQQKRPETIPIIREKALELLEIDEENFRERLELFVGDYIKIRDAIRQAGIKDDTVGFYSLFDGMVNNIAKAMIQPTRVAALLNVEHIKQAIKYIKSHGDFQVLYQPYVGDYLTKEDEDMILAYPTHNIEGHKGQKEEIFIVSPGTKLASGHNIGNNPTANLSVLELTPTLFLDTEVAINPDAFKEAIEQLRQNEGNIPVVLLTKETKDTLEAKLKGLDLKGVQFRTPQELGLENLQWDKDERVSLIDGIDNLGCIPLTKPLCETFKDLQRARDQV